MIQSAINFVVLYDMINEPQRHYIAQTRKPVFTGLYLSLSIADAVHLAKLGILDVYFSESAIGTEKHPYLTDLGIQFADYIIQRRGWDVEYKRGKE